MQKKVSENMLYLKSYGLSKLGTSAKHIMKLMKKNKEIPFNVFWGIFVISIYKEHLNILINELLFLVISIDQIIRECCRKLVKHLYFSILILQFWLICPIIVCFYYICSVH